MIIGNVDGIDVEANEEGIELSKKYSNDTDIASLIKYSDEYMLVLTKEEESLDKKIEIFIEKRNYKGIEYCFQVFRTFQIKRKGFTTSIEEVEPMYKVIMDSKLFNILACYVTPTFYQNFTPYIENEFKKNIDILFNVKIPEIINYDKSEIKYLEEIEKIYEGGLYK